jgi:hypothetical protein
MALDDDNYVLDADGNRVLIGLTPDETREYERLDASISALSSTPLVSTDDRRSQNERRWLVLFEKHQSALEPFLMTPKTKH